VIHLDTHVLLWVCAGDIGRLPARAARRVQQSRPIVSPMVGLELQYLHEIGRVARPAYELLDRMRQRVGLVVSERPFPVVAARAWTLDWTRDPFDRLIAAAALVDDLPLITADQTLLANCAVAEWD